MSRFEAFAHLRSQSHLMIPSFAMKSQEWLRDLSLFHYNSRQLIVELRERLFEHRMMELIEIIFKIDFSMFTIDRRHWF